MNRLVLADTGPLYAALDITDQYHERAQGDLERLTQEKREVIIAYPILFESYSLVLYRLGSRAAASWLKQTMDGASFLNPTPQDYRESAKQLRSFADEKITLFDAITAVVARRLNLQVWSYDHHFDVMRVRIWR